MVKYADDADKSNIRECFESIPKQLAKENKITLLLIYEFDILGFKEAIHHFRQPSYNNISV